MPRGVRLSAGSPKPVVRASSTEEKNGKSASTNSAQVASPRSPPVAGPDGSAAEAATANRYNTNGKNSALDQPHLAGQTVNFIRALLALLLGRIDTRSFPGSQDANEIEEDYQIASSSWMGLVVGAFEPLRAHVRVNLRRGQVRMAEEFLHAPQVCARIKHVGRVTVPQLVRSQMRVQAGQG